MTKKKETSATAENKTENSVLEKVGLAAIKEHALDKVFVASDGTVFHSENDAKNYATNLKDKNIVEVKNKKQ